MLALRICLLSLILLAAPAIVRAAQSLVVIETTGATDAPKPGELVKADQKIKLDAGSEIVLLGPSGKVIRIKGPFDGPVSKAGGNAAASAGGEDDKRLTRIATMISDQLALTATLGTSRSTPMESEKSSQDPWVVRLGRSGPRCVPRDGATLWRSNAAKDVELSIIGPEVLIKRKPWPAGQHKMELPAQTFRDQELYTVLIDRHQVDMLIYVRPADATNPAHVAAWMAGKGCDRQAFLFLKSLTGGAR
jgi:hypothetical protein